MEKDHLIRKLAVVLHTKVVGSTLFVQRKETLALECIQAKFRHFFATSKMFGDTRAKNCVVAHSSQSLNEHRLLLQLKQSVKITAHASGVFQ